MQYRLEIPQPCNEDWDAMSPSGKGRHCSQCCKTVVDFTGMGTEEIAAYLYAQRHQQVCGRFLAGQLEEEYISPDTYVYELHRSGLPFLKRIAAIFLFVFCFSARADAQKQQPHATGTSATVQTPKQHLMGKPARQQIRVVKPDQPDVTIMGGISMPPTKPPAADTIKQGEIKALPPKKR